MDRKNRTGKTHTLPQRLRMPLAAAAVTAAVLWSAMYLGDFVPFGSNTPAVTDAKLQYLDLFAYCRDVLRGQNTAAYTFSNTLGGSAAAIWAYYLASPFNLLVLLFPKEQMNLFLEVLITVKLSTASASFAWFTGERFKGRIRGSIALILSVSYGLMQYMLAQGSNVMWLDGVILLPFIALGVHRVVSTGRAPGCVREGLAGPFTGLAVPAALSVIANWYTGGINYLFSFVWFLYEILRRGGERIAGEKRTAGGKRDQGRRILKVWLLYLGGMAMGLILAAFIFVPSVMALRLGKGAEWNPAQALEAFSPGLRGNPLSVLRSYRIGEISDSGRVSLFCGSLALFGTAAFFMSGKITKRGKAAGAGLCLFTVMSYFWQPLFVLFSLLRFSDSYWYRYGYLGSFVLLYLAAYWMGSLPVRGGVRSLKEWAVIPEAGGVCVLLMVVSRRFWPYGGVGTTRAAVLMLLILAGLSGAVWAPKTVLAMPEMHRQAAAAVLAVLCVTESFLQTRAMLSVYHTDTAQEYETYSRQEQAQIRDLGEFDSGGFYRVNQTSTRIGNKDGLTAAYLDAMAYGYASVSGYTSCPENIQLDFLDKLGYRKEYESFNIVNTSFLPADSLLCVRYVLSPYEIPGLRAVEELGTYNGKAVYENPFVLPAAMICGPETEEQREEQEEADLSGAAKDAWGQKKQGLPSASDPFTYLEDLYSRLAGREADLFVPVDFERHYADGVTAWTLQVPEGQYCLYGNLPWQVPNQGRLTVAEDWGYGYGGWLSPSVFYIPVPKGEKTVRITLETQGQPGLRDEQFAALDLAALAESADRIRKKASAVRELEIRPGEVTCTVEGESGQSLLLSIPYSQGWTARVNGQKTETAAFEDALIQIPLVQGENHITMQYRVPGAGAGILLSLAGSALSASWIIMEKKRKRGYRQ